VRPRLGNRANRSRPPWSSNRPSGRPLPCEGAERRTDSTSRGVAASALIPPTLKIRSQKEAHTTSPVSHEGTPYRSSTPRKESHFPTPCRLRTYTVGPIFRLARQYRHSPPSNRSRPNVFSPPPTYSLLMQKATSHRRGRSQSSFMAVEQARRSVALAALNQSPLEAEILKVQQQSNDWLKQIAANTRKADEPPPFAP
jgi:hypothetical protein